MTKKSLCEYFMTAIAGLFTFCPIELASIIDANLLFKILATLFFGPLIFVCLYFLYIQFTYKTQEITQEVSIISYEFKSPIPLKTTGDEQLFVRILFGENKKQNIIDVPMTKRDYDALNISETDNKVVITARVKVTAEDKVYPILIPDFITVTDIQKSDFNVEKSDFV